jgi:hypothetical protein
MVKLVNTADLKEVGNAGKSLINHGFRFMCAVPVADM